MTEYPDISPQTMIYHSVELLKRAAPHLLIEKFAQTKPLPTNSTKVMGFSRYTKFDNTPVALVEGVTPSIKQLTKEDVSVTLQQFGDIVGITDVVADTHEDQVLSEARDLCAEQAVEVLERDRWNTLRGGTSVFYTNGALRTAVNTVYTRTHQRRVAKALRRQNAGYITQMLKATASYGTQAVKPAYIALCHVDLRDDIEDLQGFKKVEDYGSMQMVADSEVGSCGDVRYVTSTLFNGWASGGATGGVNVESTNTTNADIYPIVVLGKDAFACVPLKGKGAITPSIIQPKPSNSDPLGQRGYVAWKAMTGNLILNQAWMARIETACTK